MEPIQCSETSVFDTQTPGKYPEDNLSLLQHGESLKSKITYYFLGMDPAACIYLNHEFMSVKENILLLSSSSPPLSVIIIGLKFRGSVSDGEKLEFWTINILNCTIASSSG